jgi:hypothetical protein
VGGYRNRGPYNRNFEVPLVPLIIDWPALAPVALAPGFDRFEAAPPAAVAVPAAEGVRAAAPEFTPHVGASVEATNERVASVATAVRDERRGVALARRALEALAPHRASTTAHVFALRGAVVVMLRGDDPLALVRALELARAQGPAAGEDGVDDVDAEAIGARLGGAWAARSDRWIDGGLGIGAGVPVPSGGGGEGDPDAPHLDAAEQALRALAAAAHGGLEARGEVSETGAEVMIEGARVRVRADDVPLPTLKPIKPLGARHDPA